MINVDIIENFIDAAGFRRVIAQIDGGKCISFKFDSSLTVEEMKQIARDKLDTLTELRNLKTANRNRLNQINNGVRLYFEGTLNNNQKASLLDALAKEWIKHWIEE